MARVDDLLDKLDPRRFDVEAIVNKLNEWETLAPDVQDEEEFGAWGYSDANNAFHSFGGLMGDAHNMFCVIRDLDGSLQLVSQVDPRGGPWEHGPLSEWNLSPLELDACLDDDQIREDEYGISLTSDELRELVDLL